MGKKLQGDRRKKNFIQVSFSQFSRLKQIMIYESCMKLICLLKSGVTTLKNTSCIAQALTERVEKLKVIKIVYFVISVSLRKPHFNPRPQNRNILCYNLSETHCVYNNTYYTIHTYIYIYAIYIYIYMTTVLV